MTRAAVFLLPLALLSACAAVPADIAYRRPPPASIPGIPRPLIGSVTVTDHRGAPVADAGAISGYDGRPLKRLTVGEAGGVPVLVGRAVTDALAARGDLAPPGGPARYDVAVTVDGFAAGEDVDYTAEADLEIRLIERRTGRVVFATRVDVLLPERRIFVLDDGAFGSPAIASSEGSEVLSHAIDRALDAEGFGRALVG